jgi:excinuclease UvrABC nuclease subunit
MVNLTKYKKDLKPKKKGQWAELLNHSGVYVFSLNNTILYVGRSKLLYQRIISHYTQGGICHAFDWDAIHFIFCDNHKERERELIEEFRPLYNGYVTSRFYYSA